jgi:2-polyprenyl-6-methoxyphenol hydroxylase-like FAD-dependent oxidoreductase
MRYRAHPGAKTPRRPLGHAVVLGGSVVGLLAARVLSDQFDRVTLIERDALADRPEPRKGVPQGNHLHALLARGRMIAEALLPGLCDELLAAGAMRLNAGRDLAWHQSGAWRIQHDSGLFFLSMSRPLLESTIAKRVRARPNVTVLDGVRVIGLQAEDNSITGVRLARSSGCGQTSEIEADLVVDAMGRGSSLPQWLMGLGVAAPRTELVGARVSYATRTFRRLDHGPNRRALVVAGKPARRSGLMFPIEGDRWLVTLPGFFDEPMPQDHNAFLAYARSLAVPDIYETIRNGEPLSEIKRFRFIGSLRRRYERLEHVPEGLIAMGDAVCSFNPVYGQGMTVGAIEAEALSRAVTEARVEGGIGPDFGQRWFQTIRPVVDAAWNGVRLEDFRFPELARERPLRLRPLQWYMERVQQATHRSAFVTDRFYRVMNFLEPPSAFFSPRVMAEVLLPGFGSTHRGTTTAWSHAPVCRAPQASRVG